MKSPHRQQDEGALVVPPAFAVLQNKLHQQPQPRANGRARPSYGIGLCEGGWLWGHNRRRGFRRSSLLPRTIRQLSERENG